MSQAALSAFRSSLAGDAQLLTELLAAVSAGGKTWASTQEVVNFAKARGYVFSTDELSDSMELSDHELDAVSGGTLNFTSEAPKQTTGFDCSELTQWAVHR